MSTSLPALLASKTMQLASLLPWLRPPDCLLQGNVTYYCVNRQSVSGGPTPDDCPEVTAEDIQDFTTAMGSCFKAAIDSGMDIALSPHLDDGLGLGGRALELC